MKVFKELPFKQLRSWILSRKKTTRHIRIAGVKQMVFNKILNIVKILNEKKALSLSRFDVPLHHPESVVF